MKSDLTESRSIRQLIKQWRGKIVFGFVLGFGVLLALGIYADAGKLQDSLTTFRWSSLPLIFLFVCLGYLGRFWKWQLYMKELQIDILWTDSARIFFSGLAMALTPGKVGEVLKSFLLLRSHGIGFYRTAPTIFAERLTDLSAMLLLALLGIWQAERFRSLLLAGSVLVLGLLVVVSQRSFCNRVLNGAAAIAILSRWVIPLKTMYESSYTLLRGKLLIYTILISTLAWLMECIALYFIVDGLAASIPFTWAVFTFSVGSIAGGLSMLPGGLGAAEVSMTGLLMMAGLEKPVAVSATVLARFGTLWFGLALGFIVLGFSWQSFNMVGKNEEKTR